MSLYVCIVSANHKSGMSGRLSTLIQSPGLSHTVRWPKENNMLQPFLSSYQNCPTLSLLSPLFFSWCQMSSAAVCKRLWLCPLFGWILSHLFVCLCLCLTAVSHREDFCSATSSLSILNKQTRVTLPVPVMFEYTYVQQPAGSADKCSFR